MNNFFDNVSDAIGIDIRLVAEDHSSVLIGSADYAFEEDGELYVIIGFGAYQETFLVVSFTHNTLYVKHVKDTEPA